MLCVSPFAVTETKRPLQQAKNIVNLQSGRQTNRLREKERKRERERKKERERDGPNKERTTTSALVKGFDRWQRSRRPFIAPLYFGESTPLPNIWPDTQDFAAAAASAA
jgi:Ni/Co efflux regulator RcnB